MNFKELATKMKSEWREQHVLAFDPGHTTGYACFASGELKEHGEIDTSDMRTAVKELDLCIGSFGPDVVVMEDYRVYRWRAKHHVGSELLTVQVIGAIQTIAIQEGILGIFKQPAHIAKGFCTNGKLAEWNFYSTGEKHGMDAVRHGAYYLLFGPIQNKDKQRGTVG